MAAQSAIGTTATTPHRAASPATPADAAASTLRGAVDTLYAHRESGAREEGMTQPYDELECVGGPCDGERLKIPAGANRIPALRGQDAVRWFEPGVYERTRATRSIA